MAFVTIFNFRTKASHCKPFTREQKAAILCCFNCAPLPSQSQRRRPQEHRGTCHQPRVNINHDPAVGSCSTEEPDNSSEPVCRTMHYMLLFCYVFSQRDNKGLASRANCISRHSRLLLAHALTTHRNSLSLSPLPSLPAHHQGINGVEPSPTMYKPDH